jgi:hypothetical protein
MIFPNTTRPLGLPQPDPSAQSRHVLDLANVGGFRLVRAHLNATGTRYISGRWRRHAEELRAGTSGGGR